MPRPDNGVTVVNPVHKGASIGFIDYRGRTASFSLKSNGGDVSRGDAEDLAEKVADCSNATFNRVEIHNRIEWGDGDLIFYDDAEASVSEVIVVVLIHESDPKLNQELIIPAYDASLLVPGTDIVDVNNAALIAAAERALDIVNDDDLGLPGTDIYSGWRAFATTRQPSTGKRGGTTRNLPAPTEPGPGDNPPDAPGELP